MADRYFSAKAVEDLASQLLAAFEQRRGRRLTLPISAEDIVDDALTDQLGTPLWEPIDEPPGLTILGGLAPQDRLIILNESRKSLLLNTEGLANTTVAHEIGHWVLHIDQTLIDHPTLPGFKRELKYTCARGDQTSWDERNAHRFMGYLLMPRWLLLPLAEQADLTCWPGLYRLREQVNVTITALKVRLSELGLVYIDQDGSFHRSREEARGQQRLL